MSVPRLAHKAVQVIEAGLRVATSVSGLERNPRRSNHSTAAATDGRALFISVKPRYADAILDGRKTVELRRTRPNLPDGSLIILYSSTPMRAVVGWAQLTGVREGTPVEIWDGYGDAAAITEVDYDAYFDGTDQAFAIELDDVVAAEQPIPLSTIRELGIQPPQSWRYVPAEVMLQIQASASA